MTKLFFEYKDNIKNYWNIITTINIYDEVLLDLLFQSFNKANGYIVIESDENYVYIQDMLSIEDNNEFEEDNEKDIPTLKISKENYYEIIKAWNDNTKKPKPYLILSQNRSGWISLETKTKLSSEDIKVLKESKIKAQAIN